MQTPSDGASPKPSLAASTSDALSDLATSSSPSIPLVRSHPNYGLRPSATELAILSLIKCCTQTSLTKKDVYMKRLCMRKLGTNEERAIFIISLAEYFTTSDIKRLVNAQLEEEAPVFLLALEAWMSEAWEVRYTQLHNVELLLLCVQLFVQIPLQKGKVRVMQKLKIFRLFKTIMNLSSDEKAELPQPIADTLSSVQRICNRYKIALREELEKRNAALDSLYLKISIDTKGFNVLLKVGKEEKTAKPANSDK